MNNFKQLWKQSISNISTSSEASSFFLLLDLIKGRNPKESGFTKIKNPIKLSNGQDPWNGLKHASNILYWMIKREKPLVLELIKVSGLTIEEIEHRRIEARR